MTHSLTTALPARDPGAAPRTRVPAWAWGALLLFGGALVWASVPGPAVRETVPKVWRETVAPEAAARDLESDVRPGATRGRGDLLKLWWPAHPLAREYRIAFRGSDGEDCGAVTIRGNIFLYDLDSNGLRLPAEFTWEVIAVLPDRSEVRTPPRRHSR